MANKNAKPPKHAQFKKGQSGNPAGGRLHNPVTKALKNLTIETYREVIQLVLTGNVAAIKAMVEHPSTPAIQVGIATAFMKAIKNGDYAVIERIAERIVGKIPDELKVTSNNTNLVGTIDPTKLKAALAKLDEEV